MKLALCNARQDLPLCRFIVKKEVRVTRALVDLCHGFHCVNVSIDNYTLAQAPSYLRLGIPTFEIDVNSPESRISGQYKF